MNSIEVSRKWIKATMVLLLIVAIAVLVAPSFSTPYRVPVHDFRSQRSLIRKGMSREQVFSVVSAYDSVQERNGAIYFMLEPLDRRLLSMNLKYAIVVMLDDSGKVARAEFADY